MRFLQICIFTFVFAFHVNAQEHSGYNARDLKTTNSKSTNDDELNKNANSIMASTNENLFKKVAQSKEWHKLMRYMPKYFGGVESQLDGDGYFLSKKGKTDPELELRASLEALSADKVYGYYKQTITCAFPERTRFLAEKFSLKLPKNKCEKLDQFMLQFYDPQSVSLVFSSAYPNNPASMFGHTFLKINSKRQTDLLDIGINFAAAVADDENPFRFFAYGVAGGYKGQWSTQPYYVKVSEYSDFESRDLWEYKLNMTAEETTRLIHHFWELETNSYYRYYFFDENCSYQILAAIAAVKPEWDILDHIIYVIPGESVKNVALQPGIVTDVSFRPSAYKRLFQRYDALDHKEQKKFQNLTEGTEDIKNVSSRFVLDALLAYYDYFRNEKKSLFEKEYKEKRENLLIHRAKLGLTTVDEKARLEPVDASTRPDMGHDAYSISLIGGYRNFNEEDVGFYGLKIKSAYHDLLNNDMGYSRYAHIDFPSIEFNYDDLTDRIYIEELIPLATTSLFPLTFIDKRFSWKFAAGLFTPRDYNCDTCHHVFSEVGFGATLNIVNRKNIFYGLVTARAEFYDNLSKGHRSGPGLDLGVILNPVDKYKMLVKYSPIWFAEHNISSRRIDSLNFEQSFSLSRNYEIRNQNSFVSSSNGRFDDVFESRLEFIHFFK